MKILLVLNGKVADDDTIREAVATIRQAGIDVSVRVTWERYDAQRFAAQSADDQADRVVAVGGDGTLNEVVNGLMQIDATQRPILGIMPRGSANDFARSVGILEEPLEALTLAASDSVSLIDVGRAANHHFINVASGGFGAMVTASTPPGLKHIIGGGAYSVMGVIMMPNFVPFEGRVTFPDASEDVTVFVAAIGNGRQAGGGQIVAPHALLDDGLLDVLIIRAFPASAIGEVIEEMADPPRQGVYVSYRQTPWVAADGSEPMPLNLDGEPVAVKHVRFEVLPKSLYVALPPQCPLLSANQIDEPVFRH